MNNQYDVHSEFNIESHKEKFVRYLEVLIDKDGNVMYAVPSHQEKAIFLACEKLHISRDELLLMCPREYYGDFLTWLCQITGVVFVWTDMYFCINATKRQRSALRTLKLNGIYEGPLIKENYQKRRISNE